MNLEEIRIWLEMGAYVAGVASVLFLAIQLSQARKLEEYKMLQALEEKYTSLLWVATDHSEIDGVWKDIPKDRKETFESLCKNCDKDNWPVWENMSEEEQNCYRFSRSGLEILEQAYIAKKKGWVDDPEIWAKWEGWMTSWKNTNPYVPYVLMEIGHWFSPAFLKYFNNLK